jgi:glycyl-tRNA synthetase beta subunit
MSRIVMKNGDIVNLESYDWRAYQSPVQLAVITRELREKAEQCKNDYPGHKVSFCFDSEFGAIPDAVKKALEQLGIDVQTWP